MRRIHDWAKFKFTTDYIVKCVLEKFMTGPNLPPTNYRPTVTMLMRSIYDKGKSTSYWLSIKRAQYYELNC